MVKGMTTGKKKRERERDARKRRSSAGLVFLKR